MLEFSNIWRYTLIHLIAVLLSCCVMGIIAAAGDGLIKHFYHPQLVLREGFIARSIFYWIFSVAAFFGTFSFLPFYIISVIWYINKFNFWLYLSVVLLATIILAIATVNKTFSYTGAGEEKYTKHYIVILIAGIVYSLMHKKLEQKMPAFYTGRKK
jgi:hypothetical protein